MSNQPGPSTKSPMGNHPYLFTMIPFGAPGVGKSNLLNKLLGYDKFESSQDVTSGVTKCISKEEGPAFGKEGNPILRVYDLPGVGDMELPIVQILADVKSNIGPKEKLDAALVVLKMTDYRTSIQEMYAIKTISRMIDNSKPDNTFMILTHCDIDKPSEKLISGKLNSFKKYGPLEIKPDNVIKFDNSTESLEDFVFKKLKKSDPDMHFHENLEEKASQIMSELPGDFNRQDASEGTNNAAIHQMVIEMYQQQNEELKKTMKDTQNQMRNVERALERLQNKSSCLIM